MGAPLTKARTILHVLPDLFPHGGTPRKLLSLVQHSDPARFHHAFLLFAPQGEGLTSAMQQAGATVFQVNRPRSFDLRLLFDIWRTARRCEADLINTHFPRSDIFGLLVGRFMGIPVIKSVHGILWSRNRLLCRLDRLFSSWRCMTICNSEASEAAERSRSGVVRTVVVHNGVAPLEEAPPPTETARLRAELGIPPEAFVLGHIGGLIPLRQHALILEALSLLPKGTQIHFVLVGDGPEWTPLETRIQELGLACLVHMLGYRTDIARLLSLFDGYVNVATEEGFGIAVVEAMHAEIPVVLANSGGLRELVRDGESGLFVPPGDPRALARALSALIESPALRQRLGSGGKARATECFSIRRFSESIHTLYLAALPPVPTQP